CTLVTVPPSISTFTLYFFCRFVFFIFLFFFFFFPYTALSRFYSLSLHDALPISIHYAATVTDKNGSILVGARPVWTTGDSSIATVLQDGSVVARGPGRTMVSVVVGKLVTHSTVIVRQRVASVEVARAQGDSVIVLPEGSELQLVARAMDARGYPIDGLEVVWHIDDNGIAGLDSAGLLTGRSAG